MKNYFYYGIFAIIFMCFPISVLAEVNTGLSVRGEAVLMVAPDQVSVTIGVVSEAKKVKIALRDNTQKMQAAIERLTNLGFTKDDYKTQGFSIQPQWSNRSNLSGSNQREIIAYRVNNQLRLTTTRLEDIGEIIALVASAGVNQVQSVQFDLANPRQYREQAIQAAADNAKADAMMLAKASGVRLIKVRSLNLNNASASIVQVPQAVFEARALSAESAPPIQAGDIAVRASVNIVYEIDGSL